MTYIDTDGQMHDDGCFKPPKCEDCWFAGTTEGNTVGLFCKHETTAEFCDIERAIGKSCGPEGKLFAPQAGPTAR
jgi:hypothetical protein